MYKCINGWTKKKMIAHIKSEFKGKSEDHRAACMYRGPDGKKCAVGMFIPDDKYQECFEGRTADLVLWHSNLTDYMPLAYTVMTYLQREHDTAVTDETCLSSMLNWIELNVEDV